MTLEIGTQLKHYTIEKRIGSGGMGEVYLARDTNLKRPVAIKILLPRHANDPALVKRFEIEAQAVAQLNHPNIVKIYEINVESDPVYMAMEYIEGVSLDILVRQKGKLSWQKALSIGHQVASALACTHERGIIHRDIKPANILLDRKMGVHVTDFGIAKVLDSKSTNLTATDAAIGSPSYMSPEHCGIGDIIPASDLFALGVTLFEAMTGELPFKAETALGMMNQITTQPTPPISAHNETIPPVVSAILSTMMGKKLGQRYESASQITEDLRAFRDGKEPTHLSAIRRKQPGEENYVFEVVVPGKSMLEASKGQSLVSDLLLGQETDIPKHVVIQPDSPVPALLAKGGIAIIAIILIGMVLTGFMRLTEKGDPQEQTVSPQVQAPPPPNQDQPPPRLDANRLPGEGPLPIGPDGKPGIPYEGWNRGDPLPEGWTGQRPGNGPRPGQRPPPGGQRPIPRDGNPPPRQPPPQ